MLNLWPRKAVNTHLCLLTLKAEVTFSKYSSYMTLSKFCAFLSPSHEHHCSRRATLQNFRITTNLDWIPQMNALFTLALQEALHAAIAQACDAPIRIPLPDQSASNASDGAGGGVNHRHRHRRRHHNGNNNRRAPGGTGHRRVPSTSASGSNLADMVHPIDDATPRFYDDMAGAGVGEFLGPALDDDDYFSGSSATSTDTA